jgi:tRNA1Val (adenine37-N6)-methyltransferase
MKVCTDACLFGAVIALPKQAQNILDIGTGTGLLSLMLAQKTEPHTQIDALEIVENAYHQAAENCRNSIFAERINCINIDFFCYQSDKKYDVLVCNPPFYKQQLPTKNHADNIARHNDNFDFNVFFAHCFALSTADADLFMLMPFYRKTEIQQLASQNNWNINDFFLIKNKKEQTPIRCIFHFTKNIVADVLERELIIYTDKNTYTDDFKLRLQDFYMNLLST